jgi:hypothetical protein
MSWLSAVLNTTNIDNVSPIGEIPTGSLYIFSNPETEISVSGDTYFYQVDLGIGSWLIQVENTITSNNPATTYDLVISGVAVQQVNPADPPLPLYQRVFDNDGKVATDDVLYADIFVGTPLFDNFEFPLEIYVQIDFADDGGSPPTWTSTFTAIKLS